MGPGRTGALGSRAERTARQYLVHNGLTPVSENFQSRGGEIDLVMLHDDCLVFVEVRFRTSAHYASPELTIDARKQRKIIRTAAVFLARTKRFASHTVRFDIVAITGDSADGIHWIRDAFRPQDSML